MLLKIASKGINCNITRAGRTIIDWIKPCLGILIAEEVHRFLLPMSLLTITNALTDYHRVYIMILMNEC
ncbi:hypothetical protein A8M58_15190 [Yersinia pestis]|nr:hypothetical protein A8M58_15190 [Yersinia pestis]